MDAVLEKFNTLNHTSLFLLNVSKINGNVSEYIPTHNHSVNAREASFTFFLSIRIAICVICIFGGVGNGVIIWLLGFRIKRNPFITYILNLSVADLGVLLSATCLGFTSIISSYVMYVLILLFLLMYSASQFLLTAISLDRCMAVFFPLWHQCKRPPHLTTIVCAFIWVLSVLLTGITSTLSLLLPHGTGMETMIQFIVNAVLCLPLMTIATVALFIKVCLKARQHRRGRLLTVILLSILFFILFAFPFNLWSILYSHLDVPIEMAGTTIVFACLNSTVNPVIYFLVGRQWKSRRRESMKMILQKVFNEGESCQEETPV